MTTTGASNVCGATLDGGALVNQGTLTFSTSSGCYFWLLQNGASFTNAAAGTLAVTGDGTWGLLDNGGAASRIVNAGTTTVALSTDTPVSVGIPFANTGVMTAALGRLQLTAGGVPAVPDTGSYSGTANGSVDFASGSRTAGSISGTGPVRVTGGTATFSGGSIGALALQSGGIGGTVSIGNLTTTGGTVTGPGTVTTTGTSRVCGLTVDGGTLVNQGTLTLDTGNSCYYWLFADAGSFTNAAAGTFVVSGDGTWTILDNGGAASRIVNAGTTTVALSASATPNVSVPFANTGAMNATGGRLLLAAGGVPGVPDTGSYSGTAASGVVLAGGLRSVTTVSGTGPLRVSGGATTFAAGTIGALELTGGVVAGSVTVGDLSATGSGTLAGPGTVTTTGTSTVCGLTLDGATLANQGGLTFDTGSSCYYWLFQNGARFTNAATGTVAVVGSGSWTTLDNGGAASAITNAGIATVTLATTTTSVTTSIPFTNSGTLTAAKGTLVLGAVTNLASGTLTGGTWNAPTGTITLPATVTTNAATVSIGATGQVLASPTGTAAFAPMTTNTGSFTLARNLTLTGALTTSGTLTVGAATLGVSSLTQSAGTTTVAAGATLNAGTAAVRVNGGTLAGTGTVRGAVSGAGTVTPGTAGGGTLTVTGTVDTAAGTTLAVSEGTTVGTSVAASGAVAVGGTKLAVTTTGAPVIGSVRTVISGSARTGSIASVTGVDVPASGGYWVVGYTPTSVTLTLAAYPTVSVANATVAEGNSGTSTLTFTVTLSAASPVPASVTYATSDGTATAGSDYTATTGTLTFPPGTTSATAPVPVIGDTLFENTETLTLTLSAPTGATIGGSTATGTLGNDDSPPALAVADTQRATSAAGGGTATFTVTLDAPSGLDASVQYATVDGTALAGTDYTATNGTLTIPAGQTTGTVAVPLTTKTTYAAPRTFGLTLSGPVGATIVDGTATGTIVNGNPNGPTVAGVVPGQAPQGTSVAVTVNGTGFGAGATVTVSGTGVTVTGVTVTGPTAITATFTLATTATIGARAVTVTSAGLSDTCAACFAVVARPVVSGTDRPNLAIGNVDVVMGVTGNQFQPGADVVLVSGTRTVPASSTTTNSPTSVTAVLTVPRGTVTGSWNLQVVNPDGGRSSCLGCVTISAAPTVTGVSPASLARGTSTAVTVSGTGFVSGAVVSVPGAQLSNVTVVNSTTITATVRVPATAATGTVTVKVINPVSAGGGFGQKPAVTIT